MEIVLREQVDVVDKFFIGRQLLLTSEIANCSNNLTFFSLFLDPAVEASFTHKGVRYFLYVGKGINLKFLQEKKPMLWHSVEDTERFKFVPKTKVEYIPLGKISWSFNKIHFIKVSKKRYKPNLYFHYV